MSVDRRRAGFRLPWTADDDRSEDAQASAVNGADQATGSEAETPAAEAEGTVEANVAVPATPDSSDAPPQVDAPAAADEAAAPAVVAAAQAAAEPESSEFLQSLVGAMRGVAETSRDSSLADLRTAIDARIDALGTMSAEKESDLRRAAELDLEGIGEWEHTEIERIRGEAEHKRDSRRTQLEKQLAEHRTASEHEVESTRSRLAEHERDLAAYFVQLTEITDPAAFVAAAKRMPRAPELNTPASSAPAAATPAEDPRLAALGMSPEAPTEQVTEAAATTPEPAPADGAEATTPEAPDPEATTASGDGSAVNGNPDNRLAQRLAQLDQRLSGATQPVAATAGTSAGSNGGEGSTPIIVKGLGSFGAITSFKQALERVEGVRGVTLSLGPTGEFVYRASHAGDFDLVAAIEGIEGPTATIEDTDGTLVVTLSRAR
jgi:hypothetical protein